MFTSLVKFMFPSIKKGQQSNYFYFENSKKSVEEMQSRAVRDVPTSRDSIINNPTSTEDKYRIAFYDYLFGQSPPTRGHDELSQYVTEKIDALLAEPKDILTALPILPSSLSKVIEELNYEQFDTNVLIGLIQEDPVIAAKVIELANSPYYRRRDQDVTDLKAAFMTLGSNGLMEGVINGFISQLIPYASIYYQQYGNKIWQHSLSSGTIAKELLIASGDKKSAAQGYLIGLISNLGDIIIYQLMMDAFSFVHPDCQPNSFAFKEVMLSNSRKLTGHIAKYWHFPEVITDALSMQSHVSELSKLMLLFKNHPVACYVYEANLLSELELRFENKDITANDFVEAGEALLCSNEAKQYIAKVIK